MTLMNNSLQDKSLGSTCFTKTNKQIREYIAIVIISLMKLFELDASWQPDKVSKWLELEKEDSFATSNGS